MANRSASSIHEVQPLRDRRRSTAGGRDARPATVGHVLAHLKARDRLVVHVLIDGHEPDLGRIESLRTEPRRDRVVYIETVEPHRIAGEVFDSVDSC